MGSTLSDKASPFIRDITEESGFSQDDLRRMYESGIRFSDSETTGLNRDVNGLTEFASIKAVPENGAYRLKLFQAHILPVNPLYQGYLERCRHATETGAEHPPYDMSLYEYDVDTQALAVTGTKLLRETVDGPITGMTVDDTPLDNAKPFYEVSDALIAFMREDLPADTAINDIYFNAPFDKPFLAQMYRDVETWKAIEQHDDKDVAAQYGSYREMRTQTSPDSVTEKLGLNNSARWRCLMYGFLHHQGFAASNTLDDAYRKLVDPSHIKRGDHAAVEDILMEARVGLKLMDHMDGIPTMAQLYQSIFDRADKRIRIMEAPPRDHKGAAVQGDIFVQFPAAADKLKGRAKKYWDFLAEFSEAKQRNSRVPNHILDLDPAAGSVTISAERKMPISLNLLRKLMVYERMLGTKDDKGKALFTYLAPFDSTGNRVDVGLYEPAETRRKATTVEDVHFGSLRANLEYFKRHPDTLKEDLQLISTLREHDRKIGMCVFSEHNGRSQLKLRGHLRALGDVTFTLPPGESPGQHRERIMKDADFLIRIGLIPSAEGLDAYAGDDEQAEEENYGQEELLDSQDIGSAQSAATTIIHTAVDLKENDQLTLQLSPLMFHVIAHLRHFDPDLYKDGIWNVGNIGDVQVKYDEEKKSYALTGSETAFCKSELDTQIRDLTWLLYRLERVPNSRQVSIVPAPKPYDPHSIMADIIQEPATSAQALELLTRAKVPFKAYPDHIRLDFTQLLATSYGWSQRMSEIQKEMKKNAAKLPSMREPPPPKITSLHKALMHHTIQSIESDDRGRLYINDEHHHHYPLDYDSESVDIRVRDNGQLHAERKGFAGAQRADILHSDDRLHVQTTPLMAALIRAELESQGCEQPAHTASANGTETLFFNHRDETMIENSIETARDIIVGLQRLGGGKRLQNTLYLDGDTLVMHVPRIQVLKDEQHSQLTYLDSKLGKRELTTLAGSTHALMKRIGAHDRRRYDLTALSSQMSTYKDTQRIVELSRELSDTLHDNNAVPSSTHDITSFQEEHANFGMLLHEVADALDKIGEDSADAPGAQYFARIKQIKATLARLSDGLERFDGTLLSTISSMDGKKGQPSVYRILANTKLQALSRFANDALSLTDDPDQYDSILSAMQEGYELDKRYDFQLHHSGLDMKALPQATAKLQLWEHEIRALLQRDEELRSTHTSGKINDESHESPTIKDPEKILQKAYYTAAIRLLSSWRPDHPKDTHKLEKAEWMLSRASHGNEKLASLIEPVIAAFRHADTSDRQHLIENYGQYPADLALLGRHKISARDLLAELNKEADTHVEEELQKQLLKVARAHMTMATQAENEGVRDKVTRHLGLAREALRHAGKSPDDITVLMEKKYKTDSESVARAINTLAPPEKKGTGNKIDTLADLLARFHENPQEHLAQAQALIREKYIKKNKTYLNTLQTDIGGKYDALKTRRTALTRAQKISSALEESVHVKHHVADYLQQVIAIMATPDQAQNMASVAGILRDAEAELDAQSLKLQMLHVRDHLHTATEQSAAQWLNGQGINFEKESAPDGEGTTIRIPMHEILQKKAVFENISAVRRSAEAEPVIPDEGETHMSETSPDHISSDDPGHPDERMPLDVFLCRLRTLEEEGLVEGYHGKTEKTLVLPSGDDTAARNQAYKRIREVMEAPYWREYIPGGEIIDHHITMPDVTDGKNVSIPVCESHTVPIDLRPHYGKELEQDNALIKALITIAGLDFPHTTENAVVSTMRINNDAAQLIGPYISEIKDILRLQKPLTLMNHDDGGVTLSIAKEDVDRLTNPLPMLMVSLQWNEPGPSTQWQSIVGDAYSRRDYDISSWMRKEPQGKEYRFAVVEGELATQFEALLEISKKHGLTFAHDPLISVSKGLGQVPSALILMRKEDLKQLEEMKETLSRAERFRTRGDVTLHR